MKTPKYLKPRTGQEWLSLFPPKLRREFEAEMISMFPIEEIEGNLCDISDNTLGIFPTGKGIEFVTFVLTQEFESAQDFVRSVAILNKTEKGLHFWCIVSKYLDYVVVLNDMSMDDLSDILKEIQDGYGS